MQDSGKYACSVNTLPKISLIVELIVKEPPLADSPYKPYKVDPPKAVISGPSILHVSKGSTAGLECLIPAADVLPSSLYWEKEGKVLTARKRPGISLEVEKLPGVSTTRLLISKVTPEDSGLYSCASDISSSATVWLIVSPGSSVSALKSLTSTASFESPSIMLVFLSRLLVDYLVFRQGAE